MPLHLGVEQAGVLSVQLEERLFFSYSELQRGKEWLMGTPTQLEGPSRIDKSHKAALSDIVSTGRDPRPKNLPISQLES